jgi:ABC-2 type transport system permease protein
VRLRVELLYFEGCPGYGPAGKALEEALSRERLEAEVRLTSVSTEEEARRLRFPGSPTIRVGGRDLFPIGDRESWHLGCRVYRTPEGMRGYPTPQMIREALSSSRVGKSTGPSERYRLSVLPFWALLRREVRRFLRVWTQTLLSPLLTSLLFIVVFGYGLGSRIREVEGTPYLEFILPGLILMSIISAAYGNTSSSLFDAKRDRYIDDVLMSPMSPLQMALAYVLGGVTRGVLLGLGTFALAAPLADLSVEHPLLLAVAGLAVSVTFAALGVVAGVMATRIDHIFFLNNIVIQPLAFLGGIFYSVQMLPTPLQVATYLNPVFYAVDAFRFAALGVSDTPAYPVLAGLVVLALLTFLGTVELLRRGYRLRY